jgi:polyphosphate glucokinase
MDVLVVDIGGSRVKMLVSGADDRRRFDSGKELTPHVFVAQVREATADWHYDVISIGYPGTVDANGPSAEPGNLGNGWVSFDFEAAFGRPVRVINDAAMQALGGYDGGRMLFLGLGTGVGAALVTEHVVIPLELGCLPYCPSDTVFDRLGDAGLETYGEQQWIASVTQVTTMLKEAFVADYVLLGGGNAKLVQPLPAGARRGGNEDAFKGGFRLWEEVVEPHDRRPSTVWRVVR